MMHLSVWLHVCVEICPHGVTFRACCALEPNISSTFCTHEGTLCVCVCIFVLFLKCTSFQHSKYSVVGFFICFLSGEEICNPKLVYFPKESVRLPHDCEMEKI